MATTIANLEQELRELQKQQQEVDTKIREIDNKERGGFKRNRDANNAPLNKRPRDGEPRKELDSRRDFGVKKRGNENENGDEEESANKRSRISSVITSNKRDSFPNRERERFQPRENVNRDHRRESDRYGENRGRDRNEDFESNKEVKPKITSTIVASNSENKARKLDITDPNEKARHRKMFGMLMGTLNQFQNTLTKKSEANLRREELEKKVQERVQKEEENTVEYQKKLLKEQKEKEIKLKEELRKKTEEKELELLNAKWQLHKNQLAKFHKTDAKPTIFWRPNPTPGSVPDEKKDSQEKREVVQEKEETQNESHSNESEAPQ